MPMLENKAQEEAINTVMGQVLVISCPGSGKTTTLVRRIHKMIELGIEPSSILMVTFTRDAATNMAEKYKELYGEASGVTFATIHSLCFNILKQEGKLAGINVVPEDQKMNMLLSFLKGKFHNKDGWDMASACVTGISSVKNNYLDPADINVQGVASKIFVEAYNAYEYWRKTNKMIDFDDMLLLCHEMFKNDPVILKRWQERFRFVQVDEYQDTNRIQRDILYLLTERYGNLCVVGDDDQSIYAFRGARPEIMLNFQKDFPKAKVIHMGTNYRSAQNIVNNADCLIRYNMTRFKKQFVSQRGENGVMGSVGFRGFQSRTDEMKALTTEIKRLHMQGTPYNHMAVLFRTNTQAQSPVAALSEADIPYYSTENVKTIYESSLFSDIHDYVFLSAGKGGKMELQNVLNHPNRYLREQYFRDASYDENSLLQCALYILKTGEQWQYEKAEDAIGRWMDAFGPGKINLSSKPSLVFQGLNRIDYNRYLEEYAEFRNLELMDVRELFEELKTDAMRFSSVQEWFDFAESYNQKVHEEMKRRDKDGVALTTMHKAKGLEWKVVFIIDADEGVIPHKLSVIHPEDIEEERRIFYVAMTRAKDSLFIYNTTRPSRFINEAKRPAAVQKPASSSGKLQPEDVPKYFAGKGLRHVKYGDGRVVRYEPGRIVARFSDGTEKTFQFPESFCRGLMEYL